MLVALLALACSTEPTLPEGRIDPPVVEPALDVPPEIATGDDADAIRRVLRQNQKQVKACYEQELQVSQSLTGRVAVDIDVSEGRVVTVVIAENTTGSQSLVSCIKKRIERWRFPASVTEQIYVPFTFQPSD